MPKHFYLDTTWTTKVVYVITNVIPQPNESITSQLGFASPLPHSTQHQLPMAEPVTVQDDCEFAWGKKRGIGGKKKNVQFYDSFAFDGVHYSLNDAVCLQNGIADDVEPHIGKLIKIWENHDKSRKVKVQWFFRPSEIRKFLQGIQTKENELFLACGDGKGFANVNPLESIVGKCNVVCISKDAGNPQPSDETLQKADYVYHRFFDVEQLKIVDQLNIKTAGTEGS